MITSLFPNFRNKKSYLLFVLLVSNLYSIFAQSQIVIKDDSLASTPGLVINWTKEKVYLLDGFVFVKPGTELNIEAGTVIKGLPGSDEQSSALIVMKDAKIKAIGTEDEPIIFTAESDDVSNPDDLDYNDTGLWGGLIILGEAPVGIDLTRAKVNGFSPDESRVAYGGTDPQNNSGILKYVSIRHGGKLANNQKIGGLILAGLGSGTEIDFVEVFASLSDGVACLGGTVNVKHLVVSFCKDDGLDYDVGWRGKGQYFFIMSRSDTTGFSGEYCGASPDFQTPFSKPVIYNATYIGSGINSSPVGEGNDFAILMRDRAGGIFANSIFTDFPQKALLIEDLPPNAADDSYTNLLNGDLVFKDNLWFKFGAGDDFSSLVEKFGNVNDKDASFLIKHLADSSNLFTDPLLGGISRIPDRGLDPRPNSNSIALTNANILNNDSFIEIANYKGAFTNQHNWALNWSALDHHGFFGDLVTVVSSSNIVSPQTIEIKEGARLASVYPNPVFNTLNIDFEMPAAGNARLAIYNAQGRIVKTVGWHKYNVWRNLLRINVNRFLPGQYFIALTTDFGILTGSFVKVNW